MVLRSFRCLDMKKAASHLPSREYERRSCADIRFFSTYHACPPLENLDFPILSEVTLSNLSFDASGLCVGDQALDTRALEIRSRVAVVDISVDFVPALLPNVALKEKFLILNADGFSVPLVV